MCFIFTICTFLHHINLQNTLILCSYLDCTLQDQKHVKTCQNTKHQNNQQKTISKHVEICMYIYLFHFYYYFIMIWIKSVNHCHACLQWLLPHSCGVIVASSRIINTIAFLVGFDYQVQKGVGFVVKHVFFAHWRKNALCWHHCKAPLVIKGKTHTVGKQQWCCLCWSTWHVDMTSWHDKEMTWNKTTLTMMCMTEISYTLWVLDYILESSNAAGYWCESF